MNILKTFEMFLALPLSIIRKRIIRIMHVEDGLTTAEKAVNVETKEDVLTVNVVNNPRMYNLLSSVMYKRRKYEKIYSGRIPH